MQLALSSASSDLQRNLGFSMKPKKGINQSASFRNEGEHLSDRDQEPCTRNTRSHRSSQSAGPDYFLLCVVISERERERFS